MSRRRNDDDLLGGLQPGQKRGGDPLKGWHSLAQYARRQQRGKGFLGRRKGRGR